MASVAALIVRGCAPLTFAGLDLADRAERIARRAGITTVQVVDDDYPFRPAPAADLVLVLAEWSVVEPALVTDLVRRGLRDAETAAVLVDGKRLSTDIVLLSPAECERVRRAPSLRAALKRLAIETRPAVIDASPRFVSRISGPRDVPRAETAYLRHTNGGDGEGVFTRNIRRLSIPVSRLLLRLGVSANQVTVAGFVTALVAGASFAVGTYRAGIAGALLYAASMVLDCSDGEVARGSLQDSKFGAWLETATDYLSYFVVLGGIVWGDLRVEGVDVHTVCGVVGAAATLAIVAAVGYLRARVAASNPGAFDDALAADLKRGTRLQRFAAWGRQLIKRSFVAHLILFQALIGCVPALTEIWAYGAVAALVVVAAVQCRILRSVTVEPLRPAASL